MNKLLKSLSLLVATGFLSTLAGCELYFGNHGGGGNDTWNYCGSDGFYQCSGDSCEWVSSTCPTGQGSGTTQPGGGSGSGYGCTSQTDCAAGCYCDSSGTCQEGGFCATDADCGPGYHCDTQRSSCEPDTTPPGCTTDSQCDTASGQFCDVPTGTCTQGSCAVDTSITCNIAAPVCPVGSVPLEYNGCYTGACFATASCSQSPSCNFVNDETNCLGRTDCTALYIGLNCTNSSTGQACHSGDSGCTCTDFQFSSCKTN